MAIKYVRATGGSDANDGLSFVTGWATLAWAFNASNTRRIAAGDTLAVCGDTDNNIFTLAASLIPSSSSTPSLTAPLYILGYSMLGNQLTNGNFVKITTTSSLLNGLLYFATGQVFNYCKFSNILFDGGGSGKANYAIGNYQAYQNITFDNCRFTNCSSYGVFQNTGVAGIGASWKYIQCEIDNNGKGGTAGGMNHPGSIYIIGSKIHDNNGYGILSSNVGIFINNLIYKNSGDGITYTGTGNDDVLGIFKNNVFFGNSGDGLELSATSYSSVFNNIFRSNGLYGIRTNALDIDRANMDLFSNNCSHNNTSGHIDINGGVLPGSGNITSNPLFVSEAAGLENFTLQSTSLCLNAGYSPLS